jgi:hypothetical protein
MKYQFRPYAKMQDIEVTLTGKVYEKGEHPLYTEHKIIEVVDEEGETHYAFEDELKSDEVKEQERSYSEEDMKSFADWCRNGLLNTEYSVDRLNEHLEQWKQIKK